MRKITKEEFLEKVGREDTQDDLERCNCEKAGQPLHTQCGWCDRHEKPIFECGCRDLVNLMDLECETTREEIVNAGFKYETRDDVFNLRVRNPAEFKLLAFDVLNEAEGYSDVLVEMLEAEFQVKYADIEGKWFCLVAQRMVPAHMVYRPHFEE